MYDTIKEQTKEYKKKVNSSANKAVKKVKKNHHFAVYASMAIVIAGLLIGSQLLGGAYKPTVSYNSGFGSAILNSTLDEVSSAEVAASIARNGNVIVANNVTNLADSLSAQVDFATAHESYLAKPQIVSTDAKTKNDIIKYKVKQGDSVTTLAQKFNITSNTIRWANDLYSYALIPGQTLTIPPVSGVIHTVQSGDTPNSLAKEYSANKEQIIAFNDAEINGLVVGQKIVIPGGVPPSASQSASTSSTTPSVISFSFGNSALYGGNGYSYGYCTWHAAERRAQVGRPIPRNLGNDVTWNALASRAGLVVNSNPKAGSILWHRDASISGGYGHVGFVESVRSDGSILVSDMNYVGWNVVSTRIIKPSAFSNYLFIH